MSGSSPDAHRPGAADGESGAGRIVVRDARESDLGDVAALHIDAFPDSVLGDLGVEAVRRNYRWQLNGPHDVAALVALDGDRAVGFLFGGVFRGSTIGFVKSERWYLLRRVAGRPTVLLRGVGRRRITLAVRLLLRRSTPAQAEDPAAVPRRSFGVLAIAVDPTAQGRGIGGALMGEAQRRAVAGGFEAMHLTVHPTNTSAVAFYRSLGWVPADEADGSWGGQMTLALDQDP
jgi:ribosomal protein S18 acetylase RimI-like enzyme